MGRYPDNPLDQLAKGAPGRRRKKTAAAADRMASAIIGEPSADPLSLPRQFEAAPARWRLASQIWVQQSAVLRTASRAQAGFRPALTRYCIWSQIYFAASDQLGRECTGGSYTIVWKKGDGNDRIVPHPALDIMKDAEGILRALDTEFGFTPRADLDVARVTVFVSRQGDLFRGSPAAAQARAPSDAPPAPVNPIGIMDDEAPSTTH